MGLKVGGSPSKYFNEKNKQAAPLTGDSPFKNWQFPNHINFSHANWDHIEDVGPSNPNYLHNDPNDEYYQTAGQASGFVPTSSHQQYLDEQYAQGQVQGNPYATQAQPWFDEENPPNWWTEIHGEYETPGSAEICYNMIGQEVPCDGIDNAAVPVLLPA